jgi:hypothetical protein
MGSLNSVMVERAGEYTFFRISIYYIIIRIQLNYFLNQHCSNSQYNVAQDSTQTVNEVVSCVCILVVYFQEELRFQKVPSSNLLFALSLYDFFSTNNKANYHRTDTMYALP